jgi:Protein of unknown function (DUF3592)
VFAVAGAVALLVGLGVIGQGLRADLVQRRWQHTSGRIVSASQARLTEDGRQMWDVQVSWRDSAGQEHARSFRQTGTDVDTRKGEAVDVWFDPRRPDRADARLPENAAGSGGWVLYAFGGIFAVVGALVLLGSR